MKQDPRILQSFCPCIIWGTDRTGKRYPDHRCETKDINLTIREYRRGYPEVCHVNVDIALPEGHHV